MREAQMIAPLNLNMKNEWESFKNISTFSLNYFILNNDET